MYLVDQLNRITMAVYYLSIVQVAHLPVEIKLVFACRLLILLHSQRFSAFLLQRLLLAHSTKFRLPECYACSHR